MKRAGRLTIATWSVRVPAGRRAALHSQWSHWSLPVLRHQALPLVPIIHHERLLITICYKMRIQEHFSIYYLINKHLAWKIFSFLCLKIILQRLKFFNQILNLSPSPTRRVLNIRVLLRILMFREKIWLCKKTCHYHISIIFTLFVICSLPESKKPNVIRVKSNCEIPRKKILWNIDQCNFFQC